jgi:hypothetical protein
VGRYLIGTSRTFIEVSRIVSERKKKREGRRTFLGTTNAIGSIPVALTLYARAISQSLTLSARRGKKHMPRCGSADLCSERG